MAVETATMPRSTLSGRLDGRQQLPRLGAAWGETTGDVLFWGNQDGGSDDSDTTTHCCLPSGCPRYLEDPIVVGDSVDAVKVVCNNENCREGQWMHVDCFEEWEEHILGYLRSCGRARSWSEKQRHQNLWTKKGYDLAFKACECRCGRGHLRYDLSYVVHAKTNDDRRHKKMKRKDRLPSIGNNGSSRYINAINEIRASQRPARGSFSSGTGSWSGSSPPSSVGTTPVTQPGQYMSSMAAGSNTVAQPRRGHFDFFADIEQAIAGNIFKHRTNLNVFSSLPHRFQNPYQIKTEDEGPHGNDETRCFVLTALSAVCITSVHCIVCSTELIVYDKYPLIDGTFFLSPHRYPGTSEDLHISPPTLPLESHSRRRGSGGSPTIPGGSSLVYMNAICMRCMDPHAAPGQSILICHSCRTPWSGSSLVIGTLYAYDIFAALPCCTARLGCNRCKKTVCDPAAFKFFSDYSRAIRCGSCSSDDYHLVKPIHDVFTIVRL